MNIHYTRIDSPIGPLLLAASDAGMHAIEFPDARHPVRRGDDWVESGHPLLDRARQQLDEYFAGERRTFDLPLAPQGTPFQRQVWETLATIGYGQTLSYGQLAARIASYELANRMQSAAPELVDLSGESKATLESYGVDRPEPPGSGFRGTLPGLRTYDTFARNCLLARRLVERGQLHHHRGRAPRTRPPRP